MYKQLCYSNTPTIHLVNNTLGCITNVIPLTTPIMSYKFYGNYARVGKNPQKHKPSINPPISSHARQSSDRKINAEMAG